jgi:ribosomal protein S18 acetylase RimI-like enzyme
VADRATRQAFGALTAVSFDIPVAIARTVYEPERAWIGGYHGFVGIAGGKAVAIVAIVATPDALGVYSLSTLPACRRMGYGEALLRAAVAAEQQRTGIRRVVLQSTDAGYSLYRRLGFSEVAKFSVYLTK